MGFHLTPAHVCNYEEFMQKYVFAKPAMDVLAKHTLVFDEAHHLAPKMRANAFLHYSHIMQLLGKHHTEQRVMLLTGTPEYNDRSDFSLLLNVTEGSTRFPINERDWYNTYKDTQKMDRRASSWWFNFGKPSASGLLSKMIVPLYLTFIGSLAHWGIFPLIDKLQIDQEVQTGSDGQTTPEAAKKLIQRAKIMDVNPYVITLDEYKRLRKEYSVKQQKKNSKVAAIVFAFFVSALVMLQYLYVEHNPSLALRKIPINYKKLAHDTGRYVSFYRNAPDNADYAKVVPSPAIFSQYTNYQSMQSLQFLFGTIQPKLVKFYTGIEDDNEVKIRVQEFRTIEALKRYGRCISNTWEILTHVLDGTAFWVHDSETGQVRLRPTDDSSLPFLRTLEKGCPKFVKLKKLLLSCMGRREKTVVRTDFKQQGAYLLSAYLNAHRINHIYVNRHLTETTRKALLHAYNHSTHIKPSTRHTQPFVPLVLLLDAEASEGISLLEVEHMHLLEPMMHIAQQNQSVARAVRYQSHNGLPANRRKVTVYTHAGTLDTKHLDYKGLGKVLNAVPMGMSKLLKDPKEQAQSYKMSLLHWRNIESHLAQHFKGVVPRTGFKFVDYFINPTRFVDARYTKTTTADTLVMADLSFMQQAQHEYMKFAVSANVLSPSHVLATECQSRQGTPRARFGRRTRRSVSKRAKTAVRKTKSVSTRRTTRRGR